MNFKRLLIAAIVLCSIFSFTPSDTIITIVDKLSFYNSQASHEKIYLHTDKPMYAAGEEIWFKVYLLSATFHTPDTLSKVAYVELFSSKKELIKRHILAIKAGTGVGDFHLGDSLPQDKYIIRVYTNYMKNLDENFYFIKEIQVLNPAFKVKKPSQELSQNIDLQFFPEGGNLVQSVVNRLAFKATNQSGKSVEIEGKILDEKDSTIIIFQSSHNGMGTVNFLPVKGKIYKAKIQNTEQSYSLPEISQDKYLLKVDENGKNIRVMVYRNTPQGPEKQDSTTVFIIAHTRGIVSYAAKGDLSKSFMVKIPRARFPSGITHITVFDKNFEPQCERLFFINHMESLQFTLSANKPAYKHRELVNTDIMVTDKAGNPIAGNYSVSVYDTKVKDPEKYPMDINSYLLLSSDLQGRIEEPGYYFKDTLLQTRQHLDMVMMTHGWRRFVWKNVLKDSLKIPTYFREKGLTISGKVRRLLMNKPLKGSRVKLFSKQGDFIIANTDSLGRFYIDQLNYFDSTTLILQTDNAKGIQSDLRLTINPFTPSLPLVYKAFPSADIDAKLFLTQNNLRNQIENLKLGKTIMLREIEVKEKQKAIKEEADNPVFKLHQNADYELKGSEIPSGYMDVLSALQGRVPGLQVTNMGADMMVSIRGGGQALFLLNGMAVPIEMIMTINPGMVDKVDVLISPSNTSIYGGRGGNGVIAIYTKRGQFNADPVKGITTISYPGYYKAREFYMPKYNLPSDNNNQPDIRTTLYWNPNVVTDKTGKAHIDFFTSDVSSEYKMVIEGISNTGIPAIYNNTIEVKQ